MVGVALAAGAPQNIRDKKFVALLVVASIRELFGAGSLLGLQIMPLLQDGGWYLVDTSVSDDDREQSWVGWTHKDNIQKIISGAKAIVPPVMVPTTA